MTTTDRILALALLEGPCLDCRGTGEVYVDNGEYVRHQKCLGTGKVARFRDAQGKPLLREQQDIHIMCRQPKPWREGCYFEATEIAAKLFHTVSCQGRGWVLVSGPAAVVALLEAGRPWHIGVWDRGKGWQSGHLIPGMSNHTLTKECSTIEEALATALEAATEVQDVPP